MKKPLIVIAGPTASGKTGLAIDIARHFQTEIISADSRQCYREMNIGVAKPTEAQLNSVPHHFISSHSVRDSLSAGLFVSYATSHIHQIFEKKPVAVVCGGTGLYLKALLEGLDPMPPVDPKVEEEVQLGFDAGGTPWLIEQLQLVDPDFLNGKEKNNSARLFRALCFARSQGESILHYRTGHSEKLPFEVMSFAIEHPRDELYQRIALRTQQMLEDGLVQEVESLIPFKELRALHTVGYSELFNYFDGLCSLEEAMNKVEQHTRNYAKRQITWFRNQGNYEWLPAEEIYSKLLKIR
ncbi:MAG TPA: tRNA (adenosine(37)-N6)-dimethylallyltransferase MiaA [Chitinophagaceae bacterium]|nr:tRNA (adenosine(37)-N6)-dimethylallyltransferase MiaA [Chitinophagaceae bacterium]